MIQFPATHYFNAKLPQLEPEEPIVWRRHYKFPVESNQLGILVWDEDCIIVSTRDKYKITYKEPGKPTTYYTTPSQNRLIWECFYGQILTTDWILCLDGNPYNNCINNLVKAKRGEPLFRQAMSAKKKFLQASFEYMKSRTPFIEARGIEPHLYWAAMDLPKELTGFKAGKKEVPGEHVGNKKAYLKNEERAAFGKLCWDLQRSGKTFLQIKNELDVASCRLVGLYIKFYNNNKDIYGI